MPRFAANLSYLFLDLPFLERFQAAADCGFNAVEFHFPYAESAQAVAQAARQAGVEVVLFNVPAGDWANGERGIACLPGREQEFQDGVRLALEYAQACGCQQLNVLAGLKPRAVGGQQADETLLANLRFAAEAMQQAGVRTLMEPINTRDMPNFWVSTTAQALQILADVADPNAYLQYDLYHAQVMEGNLIETLSQNLARIAHIQLADNPGRGEPGTGEINFPNVFAALDAMGYSGWIGCEYRPTTDKAQESLSWAAKYLR